MLKKGRLYSLRKDGTKDSLYLNIKKKMFLFGSSEYCTVRIYIDGIFPEHCVLTIGSQGKAYLEPLHPSALTLVNGIKIKHKVCLEDNDVVTIFIKEFQFVYPPNSLSKNLSFERSILSFSKQLKPAQEFGILILGQDLCMETPHPFIESSVSNINSIPKKRISLIESDIFKKIPEYLLKFTHQKTVNILYEKMNAQEVHSCSDKSLIRYVNQYFKESPEERKNLTLKLYEFMSFFRGLLNGNEEYLYDIWLILESVWKYCITRASEDILFLPLKSLNLNTEITAHKKSLQSRILKCTKNSSPVPNTMSEKEIHSVNNLEVSVSSNCKTEGQNQYSSRKRPFSYKKRVSLAVKRYHLRRRKSIMIAKTAEIGSFENLELLGERQKMKVRCREINSDKQDVVRNPKKQRTTRKNRKRGYNKKETEELQDKGYLKIKPGKENIAELTDNSSGTPITISNIREQKQPKEEKNYKNKDVIGLKQEYKKESIENSTGKQTTNAKLTETEVLKRSYKRKKKEAMANKTALKDEMETKLTHDLPMKQNNTSESKKRNYKKKKELLLEKTGSCKFTQECNTQELSSCQRITRSMAKKHL